MYDWQILLNVKNTILSDTLIKAAKAYGGVQNCKSLRKGKEIFAS